ncbi:hypothetical protein ACFFQ5_20615 [Pseudomonas brassicacearum]|jgi:hypothetical protein|uniref:hypothetical protein n=1 Tax=Pseudomonas TaxID=286 RepID=UPI00087DACCB|nr:MULTISPECIES: hypothetical protein [Pseudomonas]KAB0528830.1 hypothetical protein F7R20_04810 [Pseudomonas brassicacearum subsp. brassicacearum]NJP58944.1 hypothetical protein [Pseudomonas brassicacearum]UZE02152.1 hypothetical protein LOY71_05835 [Pseudomonas mediterranea]SDP09600.1 hypothetical protein SAMN04490180_0313 [Pseudomonas brassicacearum]BFE89974.1 hypothetical protein GCM10020185_05100 [Pseudomonas brassicacearum subsp. brassicacearum]
MPDHNEALASALELLLINQNAIGAAVEELSNWVADRGSLDVADNVTTALETLDLNADGIGNAIRALRQG